MKGGFFIVIASVAAAGGTLLSAEPASGLDPLRAGQAALEDAQYGISESFFRAALAGAKGKEIETAARIGLSRALQGRGAFREALDVLPAERSPQKGERGAGPWRYERAQALVALGTYDEAMAELEEADAMDAGELPPGETARLRAWLFLKQAKWPESDRAYAEWESAVNLSNRLDWVESWAGALLAAGQPSRAAQAVRRALERTAGGGAAEARGRLRVFLGRVLFVQGMETEAEQEWRAVVTSAVPPAVQWQAWLGIAALEERRTNLTEAIGAASNALALAGGPLERRTARKTLGLLQLQRSDPSEGVALLKGVIAEDPTQPDCADLQLSVGRALLNAGRYGEAEKQFRIFLESFPEHARIGEAMEGRGWALEKLERHSEAAEAFEKAAERAERAEVRRRLLLQAAGAYFANRQYKTAAERYRAAAEGPAEEEGVREALFQEAECLARQNRPAEGRARFQELATAWGDTVWGERAALRVAELMQEEGDLVGARQVLDRFLEKAVSVSLRARALYVRGLILFQQYAFDAAFQDFSEAVERSEDPALVERAFYMQVCAAFERDQDFPAQSLAREFLARWPESLWGDAVRFRLAESAYNRGRFEEAEQSFAALAARTNAASPLAGDALFWAARSAAARKEFARAVEYDSRLLREYPQHGRAGEALFFQAEALFELGNYEGAAALFDETIRRLPGTYLADAALGRKGDCFASLGTDRPERLEEAIRIYDELASHTNAVLELRLQAAFKSGRTRQRVQRNDEAFERYYAGVILPFLEARRRGQPLNEPSVAWFTRAAFEAASLLEAKGRWREAIRLYERVADAGVPAAPEARRRSDTLRREHWQWR